MTQKWCLPPSLRRTAYVRAASRKVPLEECIDEGKKSRKVL
jgi:hypothetical protein